MRRVFGLALSGAVLAGAMIAGVGVSTTLAAPCLPTPVGLTAQQVDPPTVTGLVDGSGCDIVIYTSVATAVTNATIQGAQSYGIYAHGPNAVLTVSNSTVQQIGDVPFNGVQRGVGIRADNGASTSIDSSTIKLFQKNGTVFTGTGTTASITNSTVTGNGSISYIAQNGIQFSSGASGAARGNLVQNIDYTGCSNQDAAKTGCVPYVAVGILLYDVDAKSVDTSNNKFRNDQRNLYVITSAEVK
jgi:hypothetical protein